MMLRRITTLALTSLLLVGFFIPPVTAQGGEGQGTTTIHVVQRDENLYRIAQQYGTTVDAIAIANGIEDARYIAVGQRLLIPGAQQNVTNTAVSHEVRPGDSLQTLAYTYHTTVEDIAAANHITNPALLYQGQALAINQGKAGQPTYQALHRVQPGENLFRVALQYGLSAQQLARVNNLAPDWPVSAGQQLWIPGAQGAGSQLVDLPLPFTSAKLNPLPAVQGKTLSIRLTTSGPATLEGKFLGYPVQVVTNDGNQHAALVGIHAFAAGGVFPMTLTATTPNGKQSTLVLLLRVNEGGYGAESISITTEKQDLLNKNVTEPEWQRIATVMSAVTSQRYFEGVMGLPSTGAITSQFGTRRTYNGGVLDTFHSGTDFGAASGSPVIAPASGVVVLVEELPVRGNVVIVDHGWGLVTGYYHLSEQYVSIGDVLTPGQVLGAVGSTGRSTGPHLHWEMWVSGVQVDPMQWVQQSFP